MGILLFLHFLTHTNIIHWRDSCKIAPTQPHPILSLIVLWKYELFFFQAFIFFCLYLYVYYQQKYQGRRKFALVHKCFFFFSPGSKTQKSKLLLYGKLMVKEGIELNIAVQVCFKILHHFEMLVMLQLSSLSCSLIKKKLLNQSNLQKAY